MHQSFTDAFVFVFTAMALCLFYVCPSQAREVLFESCLFIFCLRIQICCNIIVTSVSMYSRFYRFLANVNSRSLFAVACPSVVCLSVTLVCLTQAVQIFGNVSTALGSLVIR